MARPVGTLAELFARHPQSYQVGTLAPVPLQSYVAVGIWPLVIVFPVGQLACDGLSPL